MRQPRAGFGREEEGGYWQEHKFSHPRNPLFAAQKGKMVMDAMPLFYAGHLSYLTSDFQPTILFPCLGLSFVFFLYISSLTFVCYSVLFIRLFHLLHFVSRVPGFLVSFLPSNIFCAFYSRVFFSGIVLSFSFYITELFHSFPSFLLISSHIFFTCFHSYSLVQ